MDALCLHAESVGLWVLLEKPGRHPEAPTFRLTLRRPVESIRGGTPWVRRRSTVRPMTGTNLAKAATAMLADLKSDPPQA
jgi:hypothetical protein